ncbi:hypothetical protein FBY22_4254 [Streptomyces sp. SLBN-31]|nr:hypothetical protein FBY22_4254 [Streptomyces sp. SLBN-31]
MRRRSVSGLERDAPRRLRHDLDVALSLTDEAARRAAVDRVVQGIAEGRYGRTFQRQAQRQAQRRPDLGPQARPQASSA